MTYIRARAKIISFAAVGLVFVIVAAYAFYAAHGENGVANMSHAGKADASTDNLKWQEFTEADCSLRQNCKYAVAVESVTLQTPKPSNAAEYTAGKAELVVKVAVKNLDGGALNMSMDPRWFIGFNKAITTQAPFANTEETLCLNGSEQDFGIVQGHPDYCWNNVKWAEPAVGSEKQVPPGTGTLTLGGKETTHVLLKFQTYAGMEAYGDSTEDNLVPEHMPTDSVLIGWAPIRDDKAITVLQR